MRPPSEGQARRSEEAFEREALVHLDSLYRTARRLCGNQRDAEDLVQETMLRAWRSFHQYEPGTNCRAWLMRILHNVHLNAIGQHARRPSTTELDESSERRLAAVDDGAEGPEAAVLRDVWDERVLEALDDLSLEYRSVVVLVDVEEMSYKDAANVLDVPIGTVRSRLARGRRALASRLSDGIVRKNEGESDQGP